MTILTFVDVQKFFNNFIAQHGIDIGGAPHGAFWNTTYDNFVKGTVPGLPQTANPNTGQPLPVLIKGDGEHSNIIYALRGTAGTFWDPNTGAFGQMPAGGPYFPSDQIDDLCDWITKGCNEGTAAAAE
jgi:hypothetical protein